MTDIIVSDGKQVEPFGSTEVDQKGTAVAKRWLGSLAAGQSLERPKLQTYHPEQDFSAEAKDYLHDLRETFLEASLQTLADQSDVKATFRGRPLGHYLDDLKDVVTSKDEVAYITDFTNYFLDLIETGQSGVAQSNKVETAKHFFDNWDENTGQRQLLSKPGSLSSIELGDPIRFSNNQENFTKDPDVSQALQGIWHEYKAAASIEDWRKSIAGEKFREDYSIDAMSTVDQELLGRYISYILTHVRNGRAKHDVSRNH